MHITAEFKVYWLTCYLSRLSVSPLSVLIEIHVYNPYWNLVNQFEFLYLLDKSADLLQRSALGPSFGCI